MSQSLSERRMAENEVIFRERNEYIQAAFDEIKRLAQEDDQEHMVKQDDLPLFFYCECSDEDCKQRISMRLSVYNKIHKDRDHFVIKPGHETNKIECIILQEDDYNVVEKFITPPPASGGLNETDLNNA